MTHPQAPHGIPPDPWSDLRAHTQARLALGRAGAALPTAELLRFGMAHAQARDAVHIPLDAEALAVQLQALGCTTRQVHSAAPDRATYLLRPDLGRRLCDADAAALRGLSAPGDAPINLLLVVADGLSTGVFILGPEKGMALIERLQGVEGVIVTSSNNLLVSSGLARRLVVRSPPTDAP